MKLFVVYAFLHAFFPYASSRLVVAVRDLTEPNDTNLDQNNPSLRTHPFESKTANSASSGGQWTNRRYLQQYNDSLETADANSTNSDKADDTIKMNSTDLVLEIDLNITNCTTAFMIVETDNTGCESTGGLDNLTITGCERAFVRIVLNTTGCENTYAKVEAYGNDTGSTSDSLDDDS